ncbi:structural protein [Vibrio phage douglas 12A4]|uniref:structural protein n=1 Tax=Vibrio phage douglas 12A4 TaxID=573171 RepID=UPI0002C0916F|nr:structural protein [Vibrio phage douglas 12A4]AGG58038.1 hypothetical protein VPAG_00002 [Vibrio phage douglas 12A4]
MTTTVAKIIQEVSFLANDEDQLRWPKEKLITYFNDAIKALVVRRPDCSIGDDEFICVAGTKQVGPVDMYRLIDIPMNIDGPAIQGPYDRKILDDMDPSWRATTGEVEVELFTYDERNPTTFGIYPGVAAGTKINIIYSKLPVEITVAQIDDVDNPATTGVEELWDNALIDWMLYRCYSKDAEYSPNANRAMLHLNAFRTAIGDKSLSDKNMTSQSKERTIKKE